MSDVVSIDPVPASALPAFAAVNAPPPVMPDAWSAVVLLHPFSPPLSSNPSPDNPFFQLCLASIDCVQGQYFSARVTGCSYGQWWYVITPAGTQLSTDGGQSWTAVELGWSTPTNWYGAQAPNVSSAGASPLNWLATRPLDWWKVPVPLGENEPPAATWMWFDSATQAPVRMMFGNGPPTPTMGDPTQLAFFQMYSFIYFTGFAPLDADKARAAAAAWAPPVIPGFQAGNPGGYKPFVWNTNFGMTTFMTPVNGEFNPLPTRLLYVWKSDADYQVYSDRAQNTLMFYTDNPEQPPRGQPIATQQALLTGKAPAGTTPPPYADQGFLYTTHWEGAPTCQTGAAFPFGQEDPTWVSTPGVQGTIQGTITNNDELAPGVVINVYSVLFPPAPPNYPEATYVWAWYAPLDGPQGTRARPVTFMQSQSGVGVGTSLALADYFFYEEFILPIDPGNFDIPTVCLT